MTLRIGILTASDRSARGEREDTSGQALARLVRKQGWSVERQALLPDDQAAIRDLLLSWADSGELDLILTTGGTGFSPRDVTPEATLSVLERQAAGIVEALRAAIGPRFPQAWLSRAVAGTRGKTLIVNLAGSEKAVMEGLKVLEDFIDHAVDQVSGAHVGHEPMAVGRRPSADR